MLGTQRLALLWEDGLLRGVLCHVTRRGLLDSSLVVRGMWQVPCPNPLERGAALDQLLRLASRELGLPSGTAQDSDSNTLVRQRTGKTSNHAPERQTPQQTPQQAWEYRCALGAEEVMIQRWTLPFRSRNKIEAALPLLLSSQLPFDASALCYRLWIAEGSRTHSDVLSFALPGKTLNTFLDTLETPRTADSVPSTATATSAERLSSASLNVRAATASIIPSLVTIAPLPVCALLAQCREADEPCILIQIQSQQTVLTLLEGRGASRFGQSHSGQPMRLYGIRRVGLGSASGMAPAMLAQALYRDVQLMLEGLSFTPQRLLLLGSACASRDYADALEHAFALPSLLIGRDVRLPHCPQPLDAEGLDMLSTVALAALPSPAWWREGVPSFHRAHGRSGQGSYPSWWKAGLAAVFVGAAALSAIWAEGVYQGRLAEHWERSSRRLFQEALPTVRGSFGLMQMESILKQRAGAQSTSKQTALSPLQALAHVHRALPNSAGIVVETMRFDALRCQIAGSAADYGEVNSIRAALEGVQAVESVTLRNAVSRTEGASRTKASSQGVARSAGQERVFFELDILFRGDQP